MHNRSKNGRGAWVALCAHPTHNHTGNYSGRRNLAGEIFKRKLGASHLFHIVCFPRPAITAQSRSVSIYARSFTGQNVLYQYPVSTLLYQYPVSAVLYQYPVSTVLYQYPVSAVLYQYPVSAVLYQYPVSTLLYQYPVSTLLYQYPVSLQYSTGLAQAV
jgi:hypothetical protein